MDRTPSLSLSSNKDKELKGCAKLLATKNTIDLLTSFICRLANIGDHFYRFNDGRDHDGMVDIYDCLLMKDWTNCVNDLHRMLSKTSIREHYIFENLLNIIKLEQKLDIVKKVLNVHPEDKVHHKTLRKSIIGCFNDTKLSPAGLKLYEPILSFCPKEEGDGQEVEIVEYKEGTDDIYIDYTYDLMNTSKDKKDEEGTNDNVGQFVEVVLAGLSKIWSSSSIHKGQVSRNALEYFSRKKIQVKLNGLTVPSSHLTDNKVNGDFVWTLWSSLLLFYDDPNVVRRYDLFCWNYSNGQRNDRLGLIYPMPFKDMDKASSSAGLNQISVNNYDFLDARFKEIDDEQTFKECVSRGIQFAEYMRNTGEARVNKALNYVPKISKTDLTDLTDLTDKKGDKAKGEVKNDLIK